MCLAQGKERTPKDKAEFRAMLPNINLWVPPRLLARARTHAAVATCSSGWASLRFCAD